MKPYRPTKTKRMNTITKPDLMKFDILRIMIKDTSDAPIGSGIFYFCEECKTAVNSRPDDNVSCACGNIYIDVDYHRLAVKDFAKFKVIEKK